MPSSTRPLCPTCQRPLPVLRVPIPEDWVLTWDQLRWLEQRVIVAMMIEHVRGGPKGDFAEWSMMEIKDKAHIRYRQVSNAMRRLVPTGWVTRVRVGRYRLTVGTVESLRPMIKRGTRVSHFSRK